MGCELARWQRHEEVCDCNGLVCGQTGLAAGSASRGRQLLSRGGDFLGWHCPKNPHVGLGATAPRASGQQDCLRDEGKMFWGARGGDVLHKAPSCGGFVASGVVVISRSLRRRGFLFPF